MNNIKMVIIMLLLVVAVPTAIATGSSVSSVDVRLVNQDPNPATPGTLVDLTFHLENRGDSEATNIELELQETFPIRIVGEPVRMVPRVPFLTENRPTIIRYRVLLDSNSPIGDIPLSITLTRSGASITKEVFLNVRSFDAGISIPSVISNPERIPPGSDATIMLAIENNAPNTIRDISIRLDLTSADLPIAPVGAGTFKKIPVLTGQERSIVTYTVKAFADATPGTYRVPVEITFFDALNNQFTQSDIIGIVIDAEPQLTINYDGTTLTKGKAVGDVSLRVINRGFSDVKFLTLSIEESDEYDILSGHEYYVGNLDSDDFERTDFNIRVHNTNAETITVPAKIRFTDTNNQQYTVEQDIVVRLPDAPSNNTGWIWTIIILAIIGGGIYWLVKRNKRDEE